MEPAGRVADHHVRLPCLGGGDGVEGNGSGVAALRPANDLRPGPVGPLRKLVDGRGAVGIGGGDDDIQTKLLLQMPGDLADRRRLAGAVDPDDHQHRGAVAQVDPGAVGALRRGSLRQNCDQPLAQLLAVGDLPRLDLVLETPDHGGGRRCADVGENQRLLEVLPRLLVDPLGEARGELGCQRQPAP